MRKSLEATRAAQSQNADNSNVSPIQRKPLPPAPYANYPASRRPPTPPKSYPHYQPPLKDSDNATQAERYAARGTHLRLTTTDIANGSGTFRKPIGARPMPPRPISGPPPGDLEGETSPSPVENAQREFRLARKPVQAGSPADIDQPKRTDDPTPQVRPSLHHSFQDQSSSAEAYDEKVDVQQSGTLRITLIRRDPASGSQWNVGTIIQHSVPAQETALRKVDVELISPGYLKFAQLEGVGRPIFSRKVAHMLVPNSEGSSVTRPRSHSTESSSSASHLKSRRPRQAYAFISPWQGMCAFSNGLDGKSLKCRHVLPAGNPSMPGVAADIAEIRFNLPWSVLRLKEPSKRGVEMSELSPNTPIARPEVSSNREQWRRSFQALTHKARAQLSSSDGNGNGNGVGDVPLFKSSQRADSPLEEGRMNLDLGRERAGGGFKGHSAKLGKLIIDDEGLKMCDLVVAACMGVWWQHYAGDVS